VSKSGNNYLLTVMDYLIKWPHAVPIPARTVASPLYNIFMVMGFPAVYSSDQGWEFVNDVISCLTEKTKAAHRISTAYHPQTNGLVERFNKTVQSIILTTCWSVDSYYPILTRASLPNPSQHDTKAKLRE
jgi:transposase InsO family protein